MSENIEQCNLLKEGYKRYLGGIKEKLKQIGNINTKTDTYLGLYRFIERSAALGIEYYNKCVKNTYPEPLYRITDHAERMINAKIGYDTLSLYKQNVCNICKNIESQIEHQEKSFKTEIKNINKKLEEIEAL